MFEKNEEVTMRFPEELKSVHDATNITMESILHEQGKLKSEFDEHSNLVQEKGVAASMTDFFMRVRKFLAGWLALSFMDNIYTGARNAGQAWRRNLRDPMQVS